MLCSNPMFGLSLLVMILLLWSRRKRVRGSGSCSGSQSASRSNEIGSNRLGGLLPAPRAGGDDRLTFTSQDTSKPRRRRPNNSYSSLHDYVTSALPVLG